ncbi:MAG: hypothetical protein ACRDBO_12270 [Lachnospiraceae bacterium]
MTELEAIQVTVWMGIPPHKRGGAIELTTEAAIATTAAQKQDDPDEISTEAIIAIATTAKTAAVVIAATAAKQQDNPDEITASISPVIALEITSTVSCCHITHINSSKNLFTSYLMLGGLS